MNSRVNRELLRTTGTRSLLVQKLQAMEFEGIHSESQQLSAERWMAINLLFKTKAAAVTAVPSDIVQTKRISVAFIRR